MLFVSIVTFEPEIFYTFFHQWSDLMRCDLLPVISVGPRFNDLVKQYAFYGCPGGGQGE